MTKHLEIVSVSIASIHPSDLPRKDSWQAVREAIPDREFLNRVGTLNLGIRLREAPGGNLVAYEGNHRLARVAEILGEEASVCLPVEKRWDIRSLNFADFMIQRTREEGVGSFADFLGRCQTGRFRSPFNH